LRRSFIHEQLKTSNGTDIITIEQNEERRRRLTTPKRSARTGHANKESPLLSRLEEMSLISPLSKGGEFPALSSTLGHEAARTRSSSPSKACRDPNLVIKHGKDVLAWKALTCFPLSHPRLRLRLLLRLTNRVTTKYLKRKHQCSSPSLPVKRKATS
jgi:hypothetical protein